MTPPCTRLRATTHPSWGRIPGSYPHPLHILLSLQPVSLAAEGIHSPFVVTLPLSLLWPPASFPSKNHISPPSSSFFQIVPQDLKVCFHLYLNIPTSKKVSSLFFQKYLEGGLGACFRKAHRLLEPPAWPLCSCLLSHRPFPTLPVSPGSPLHRSTRVQGT